MGSMVEINFSLNLLHGCVLIVITEYYLPAWESVCLSCPSFCLTIIKSRFLYLRELIATKISLLSLIPAKISVL